MPSMAIQSKETLIVMPSLFAEATWIRISNFQLQGIAFFNDNANLSLKGS